MVYTYITLETKEFLKNIRVESNIPKALEILKKFELISIPSNEERFLGFRIPSKLTEEFREILLMYDTLSPSDRALVTKNMLKSIGKYLKLHIRTNYNRLKKAEEVFKNKRDNILILELYPVLHKVYIDIKYKRLPILSIAISVLGRWSLLPVNSSDINKAKAKAFKELYDYLRLYFLF